MTLLTMLFAAWLVPLLFVISAAVPLIGQQAPLRQSPLEDIGFTACRLPCWAGITPGLTPFAEASELLVEHLPDFRIPTFLTSSSLTFQAVSAEPYITGALYYDGSRVSEVHLDVDLPMWYLLDRLGTPDCVWVSRGSAPAVVSIYWEGRNLSTAAYLVFEGRLAWTLDMPIRFLQMTTTLNCTTVGMLPWMGFAPAWRYEQIAAEAIVP
jgi:hypothetical protein